MRSLNCQVSGYTWTYLTTLGFWETCNKTCEVYFIIPNPLRESIVNPLVRDQSLASVTGDNTAYPDIPVFLNTPSPTTASNTVNEGETPRSILVSYREMWNTA